MASKNTELKREIEASKQAEYRKRVEAYLEDIKKVDEKHKLSFQPIMRHQPDGSITPSMQIVEFIKPEPKKK
jgi:hypothetical protein